jgi:putative oxidoreductase
MSIVHLQTEPGWRRYGLWALKGLLTLVFLAAGGAKLAGAPMMVATFEAIGFGQWFRYLTGGLEVICAIALIVPAYSGLAALLLAPTMVGASIAHMVAVPGPAMPALVLLALNLVVVYAERARLTALIGGRYRAAPIGEPRS